MRTSKYLVLSCLFLLFAIPASLSVFAFFYHTDYEHRSAIYYANEATNRTGLVPSPTIFHFQSDVISAKQREQLANTAIPTEIAKHTNAENLILPTHEPTMLAAKSEEPTPVPTQPAPTPAETKAKDVVPTPTLFVPQPTPTTQPKTTASEPVRWSSAVIVESPASSLIIEPNSVVAQPTTPVGLQQSSQSKVCGEGEFC